MGTPPESEPGPPTSTDTYDDDDLLTPELAARIAGRSVRTIRRAYSAGTLLAYRDGGGRGVRIRHADLRDWLLREPVAAPARPVSPMPAPGAGPSRRRVPGAARGKNLALLDAARARRRAQRRRASEPRE